MTDRFTDTSPTLKSLVELNEFCLIDVGSTTTKAILFKKESVWKFWRKEAPTTVEKPFEDVTFGVVNAIRMLEKETGRSLFQDGKPCLPLFSTSSAGGGLAVVVAGLVRDVTAQSAERVALGAGSIIQDVIALDDGRTPYKKIEILKAHRPDMLLLAGGFDGGALHGPVFLAELINQSNLRPKLSLEMKLPVIFAGNIEARKYITEILSDRFVCYTVPNIRPSSNCEKLEPARNAIHDVFMEHVMSRAPGYEKYKNWVSAPILPTPAAVARLMSLVSRQMQNKILAIDIGGATTDIFTAENGKVFRTVSANLGMSYSILNVVRQAGPPAVKEMLDFEISEKELLDIVGNKFINPTALPGNLLEEKIECAVASIAIREAVREHFRVMYGVALSLDEEDLTWNYLKRKKKLRKAGSPKLPLSDYDMLVGSGGILSHLPRKTATMMLLNALQPEETIDLAVDSVFMFPHLGVLSQVNEPLALELFYELGLIRLGKLIAPTGKTESGEEEVRLEYTTGRSPKTAEVLKTGGVTFIPLPGGEQTRINLKVKKLKLHEKHLTADSTCGGLIVDLRGRPAELRSDYFLPGDYRPNSRNGTIDAQPKIFHDEIRISRELAIPGAVYVKPGETVLSETIVAKSTKSFLRPFFLNIAERIDIAPEQLPSYFHKKIGDEISVGEILAEHKSHLLAHKIFRSTVSGTVEKILPNGAIIVREKFEYVRNLHSLKAADELKIEPEKLKPYIKCEIGQEVEKNQELAATFSPVNWRTCKSPVRGKVKDINYKYGLIIIEPLSEELELEAWMPGLVDKVTDKGCIIVNQGTIIQGVWGNGGQAYGKLSCDEIDPDFVMTKSTASRELLSQLQSLKVRGLVTGSISLIDLDEVKPEFPILISEGFGETPMNPEILDILRANEGRIAAIDATTQLRAGVKRPQLIIPQMQLPKQTLPLQKCSCNPDSK